MAFRPPVSAINLALALLFVNRLLLISLATWVEPVNATPAISLQLVRYEPTSEPVPKHSCRTPNGIPASISNCDAL